MTGVSVARLTSGVWSTIYGGFTAPAAPVQPTGAGIVRYQDLTGANFSAVWKAAGANTLSLEPKTYQVYGLNDGWKARWAGVADDGGGSTGIIGAGSGYSIMQLVPNSATYVSIPNPPANWQVLMEVNTKTNYVAKGFAFRGSPQANVPLFGGLNFDNCNGLLVQDVLVTDSYGNSSSPPGESFALSTNGANINIDTVELSGNAGFPGTVSKWVSSSLLATNSTNGLNVRRLFAHESRYGKAYAGWETTAGGGTFTECWAINTALGYGFEECTGTYEMVDCVFGGNMYDLHLAHTAQYNGGARATLNIRNPVYLGGQTKLRVLLPTGYTGAGNAPAGSLNQQVATDIHILRGSDAAGWTDVTANELIVDSTYSLGVVYNLTPLTNYQKPAWALSA